MASVPTPRSYSQTLGDLISAFLSRYGLPQIKVGSPVLSMFESVAQSQMRNSQDIFGLLQSSTLDQATGLALDSIGADEDLPRNTESPASGLVSIYDTSFTKISSTVFQGTAAPIVGSMDINVTDASLLTATGSVYIGRGTSNYEGPLAYSSILPPGVGVGFSGGAFWTLVLVSPTFKFHNLGETVILAQGGNRLISAGTIVQTPQGSVIDAVQFKTTYSATIPDGETLIDGVNVLALKPGIIGNVIATSINQFSSPPFTGAAVNNPAPFVNGIASEDDDTYRERIRVARQTRQLGTALAITTNAIGVIAPDENKRVLSAVVVSQQGAPSVLYIDDGTGYEERSTGVAIESFVDDAIGGEDYFRIASDPPVTKAYVLTSQAAPYTLVAGSTLGFNVGGVTTIHTFDPSSFMSIGNASAYEVVASINADISLNWNARTSGGGTLVAVFGKADTNESIQNVPPGFGDIDANLFLGFPTDRVDTMRLYKNDRLLSKDGSLAELTSTSVAFWAALGPTEDLQIEVDGTPLSNLVGGTYTFTAQDFINAKTGFTTVGINSLAAWAAVFNLRIPGITATVINGQIVITSNRGLSSTASLVITGGSLVLHNMFVVSSSFGVDSDYTLDRNTGELKLDVPLQPNDTLAAGSVNTRAFLQTPVFITDNVVATTGAHLWFAIDGNATIIPTGLTASTPVNFSVNNVITPAWGNRWRITQATGTGMFTNVQVGDWIVFWDSATALIEFQYNSYRVTAIDIVSGVDVGAWIEFESTVVQVPTNPVTLVNGGLSIVRTTAQLEEVLIPQANNYTATSLVPLINEFLVGGQATVYRTTSVRVNTTTFDEFVGDIGLVAADLDGQGIGLPVGNATKNLTGHLASIESGNSELGTPDFHQDQVETGDFVNPEIKWSGDALLSQPDISGKLVGIIPFQDGTTTTKTRYGQHNGVDTSILTISGTSPNFFLTLPSTLTGNTGTASLTISAPVGGLQTVSGMTGATFTQASAGNAVSFTGFSNAVNNGTFRIVEVISSTSVVIANSTGVAEGPTASVTWTEKDSQEFFPQDRVYFAKPYAMASDDVLTVVIDGDTTTKRFIVPMWRRLLTVGTTYGSQNTFKDADNGNQSLAIGFGSGSSSFDFNDFAVYMPARVKTHDLGDAVHYITPPATLNSTILWRYFRLGPDGDLSRVTYGLPSGPNQAVALTTNTFGSSTTDITISLASGALKTGYSLTGTNGIGTIVTSSASGISQVVYLLGFPSTSATRDGSGNVTLTLNLSDSGASNHGFVANNSIYAKNGNATFPDGYYMLTSVTSNTITYHDGGAAAGATAITGDVSFGSSEATLTGASPAVAVGDFFRVGDTSGLPTSFVDTTMRIDSLPDPQTIKGELPLTLSVNTVVTWSVLGDLTAFQVFINSAQTASVIAAAVNALPNPIIAGTVIGNGTGIISEASFEEAGSTTNEWFSLVDGINFVQNTIAPSLPSGDYQLLFKLPVNTSLISNSDWANEIVRIVPITALNIVDWLNQPTVSGLFSVADIELSSRAHKVQIASLTPGSQGSVQVQGGTANSVTMAVVGSASEVSSNMVATVPLTEVPGVTTNDWVSIDNTNTLAKNVFGYNTHLLTISSQTPNYLMTFSHDGPTPGDGLGTTLWTHSSPGGTNVIALFEKQGNFVAISDTQYGSLMDCSTVSEGDWIRIVTPANVIYTGTVGHEAVSLVNTGNTGIYRVVRVVPNTDVFGYGTIWIEDPAAELQSLAECDISFFTYDSVMPGDILKISTHIWDGLNSNVGVFTVLSVGDSGSGPFTNRYAMVVVGNMSVVSVDPGILGSNYQQVQMIEGSPTRLIKRIVSMSPNQIDSAQIDVKFDTSSGYERVGATPGSIITVLNKLNFQTTLAVGIDGYQHSTGLIGEVNKVEYGDPSDTATYPGVVAAGANVNIQGPLVKRIQVSLLIRTKSGSETQDIEDRVKSAVASVINSNPIGQSIALSALTSAAVTITGVTSAVMVSPTATAGSDLITVQPYEKTLVLNIDSDVTISFAGSP